MDCVHINKQQFPKPALGDMIQLPPETLCSSSSSYAPWSALSPSPPFQEQYLLKASSWAIYNFLKRCTMLHWRGQTKAQYPAVPQTNPFPCFGSERPSNSRRSLSRSAQGGFQRKKHLSWDVMAEQLREGRQRSATQRDWMWQPPVMIGTWASKGAEQRHVAGKCKDGAR